jgi:hypothetical protein
MANATSSKASRVIVEVVREFVEVKAQIAELEKVKATLNAEITKAFGDSDSLIHHNIEVARRDWRTRESLSADTLQTLIAERLGDSPELAEIVQKMVADSTKATTYPVIVTLYK